MTAFAALPPSRHAQYGEHWGEGAARCFSMSADILDEDHAVRLMPVPDSFVCPISTAIMVDPVATVDGCVYERTFIERWFRERRQQGHRITSPVTGLELPSATLMPLVALQRAIEAYLAHRPELKLEHMAGRSFEEAAQLLQTDLFEKQAVHATTQDKVKRLKQAHKVMVRALHDAEARILRLESELRQMSQVQAQQREDSTAMAAQAPDAQGSSKGLLLPGAPLPCEGGDSGGKGKMETEVHQRRLNPGRRRRWQDGARGALLCALPLLVVLAVASATRLWPLPLESREDYVPTAPVQSAGLSTGSVDSVKRREHHEDVSTPAPGNPAFAGQLQQLRAGNLDEKQKAAFLLRIFAAENAENQVAIARAGAIGPLVGLLQDDVPALREEAARALWNLARNNKEINVNNQIAIGRAGAIRPLTRLLEDEVSRVRVVAAAVLNDLATNNAENQIAVAQAGAIKALIKLLEHDEAPALVMASSLLKSLASSSSFDADVAKTLVGAVPPLVALLKADTLLAQEQAASALGVLAAYSTGLQVAIARAGAIGPLVERLKGDMMQGTAALALRNLADRNPVNQVSMAQAGAILPLVKLLEEGMPGVREEAARALWNLAAGNLENQVAIVQAGAAIPLVALLKGDAQEQATITLLHLAATE
mmetsp:Transcript_23659/g.74359  ORF Transcript_23659/g.74359 Transcript_23659/m.74359 type:complete len:653 (+) Transcript_23659:125-2083(+)